MIEVGLRQHLLSNDTIADQLTHQSGGLQIQRVYPIKLPDETEYPAIVYQIISDTSAYDLLQDSKRDTVRVQLSMFHDRDKYKDLRELYYQVKDWMAEWQRFDRVVQLAEFDSGSTEFEQESLALMFTQDWLIYYVRGELHV